MTIAGGQLIGTEFLGYRIDALLGRGGMGVVYRAWDLRLKRNVALKLVAPELSEDERFRERFLGESELAASLDHPNVIPIYNAGEHEGQLYLAMRYVEGSDLKALLPEGPLDPGRAIAICSQVAAALDAAHARGLVHRDVKPSNVLLDAQEHVYLADFGLSRRLAEQAPELEATLSLGTPAYVAPEQIEGAEVDAQADVYSLGCLLHECLTGEAPFPRESELAVLWAHLNDPPPAPAGLEEVMAKTLAKRPEERYASCTELVNAAREALGLGARRDRRPLVLAGTGLLVAAAALTTGLVLAYGNDGATTPKADLTVRNNSLVRIDPEDTKIGAVTAVGRGPEAVAIGGNTVWTYNWDDRTVSAVDESTNLVEQTASITGFPPFTIGNSIAADADGAWVISSLAGKGLLTHLRLGEFRPRESGFSWDPISVAVGEGAVWVAAKDIRGSAVLKIDPTTGSVLDATRLRGALVDEQSQFRDVQWLAVGNGAVWAVQGGTLFRIDPRTGRVTGRLNLPVHETGGIAAGNGAVWVMVFDAIRRNGVVRIDPRTMRLTARVFSPSVAGGSNSAGYAGNALAIGEDAVWWSGGDAGVVWKIDPRTSKIASTTRVTRPIESFSDKAPYGITAGPGGVWVAVRVAP